MSGVYLFVYCITVSTLHDDMTNRSKVEQIRPVRKECQYKKNESTDSHHCIIFEGVNIFHLIELKSRNCPAY